MAHFRFPLSVGADGKRTSTHVSVNPYAISFQTNDATPVVYDGHEAKVIDLTALSVAAAGKLTNARTIGISGAVTGTATNFDGTGNITIPTTAIDVSKANAGTLAIARGGTGKTSWTAFGIVYASAKNTLGQLGVGTAGQVLQSGGSAAPSWIDQADLAVGEAGKLSNSRTILVDLASITSASFNGTSNITPGISNTLPTTHGGTGKTAWDSYKIIYASGSNTLAQLDIGSEGQVLLSQGTGKAAIWDDQSNLNAGTAAKFTTAKAVTLTGDVTGTASSQAGWSITTTIGAGKVTNAMLAGSIANSKLVNSKITIAGNDVSLGGSLAASTLVASLGLSTAMHFIGVATVAITDGSTTDPTISGYSTKTAGDVIIDKDSSREYVWSTTGKWELLGGDSSYKVTQNTVDSGAAATNKWVSRIQQNTNGVVTITMGTLDTSGTWSGNAATATKWATARTLTIGETGKSVDGSGNVSWTLAEIGAASGGHTHTLKIGYKSLSVGTSEQTWDLHDILKSSTNIGVDTSWQIYTPGVYYVAAESTFTGEKNPESANGGLAPYRYGQLIVTKAGTGGVAQFYIAHTASGNGNGLKFRTGWNNTYVDTWRSILDNSNYTNYTVTKTGTGASGTWGISITGSSASCTGLSAKATADGDGNVITTKYVTVDTAQTITGNKSWGVNGAGGILYGDATNGGINSIRIGDDVYLGDCNAGGIMGMKSTGANCGFYFYNSSGTQIGQFYCDSTNYLYANRCFYVPNISSSWIDGQRYQTAALNIHSISNTGGYNPWVNQINTGSAKWFSFGILGSAFYMIGSSTSRTEDGYDHGLCFDVSNGYLTGCTRVYNAIWNDYAEFRIADSEEPGRVVIPSNDGIAHLSTLRLQPGGRIISDTYGHAVGQSDQAKTPIGLAGRVLAYPYKDKSKYKIGDAVCTAPGGTVDIMTREEIMMYPDRIVGIVNEIPDYKVWELTFTHDGDGSQMTQRIEVNGRIWIDIK